MRCSSKQYYYAYYFFISQFRQQISETLKTVKEVVCFVCDITDQGGYFSRRWC